MDCNIIIFAFPIFTSFFTSGRINYEQVANSAVLTIVWDHRGRRFSRLRIIIIKYLFGLVGFYNSNS